jgi:hypothetical protein
MKRIVTPGNTRIRLVHAMASSNETTLRSG